MYAIIIDSAFGSRGSGLGKSIFGGGDRLGWHPRICGPESPQAIFRPDAPKATIRDHLTGGLAMLLLFLVFILLLLISATPLLGLLEIRWSLQFMLALFALFFVAGWVLFICYPLFS